MIRGHWWLYYARKQLFSNGGHGCFRTLFSSLGVALGVAVLTVVLTIMGGFHEKICQQLREAHGAVTIVGHGSLWENGPEKELLQTIPGILEANPFWDVPFLMEHRGMYALPLVRGDALTKGLCLGRTLASELSAEVGDTVQILALTALRTEEDELQLPFEATVKQILPGGRNAWWDSGARFSLRGLQEIVGEKDRIGGYTLHLAKEKDALQLAKRLNKEILPAHLHARTWLEAGGELLSMLAMEKAALFFSLACIIAMAAFCMASALAMTVMQKTQEIGLLLALGCTKTKIALSFFLQCAGIGVIGLLLGLPLAALILCVRDDLLRCLLALFGRGEEVLIFYGFHHLPVLVSLRDLVAIAGFSLLATGLAGVLPVRRILCLDPSIAIRHE